MNLPTVPWSAADDRKLSFHWGTTPLGKIEKLLGRTRIALIRRAAHLQLGGLRRGKKSLAKLCESTGYSRHTILTVVANLGMRFRRLDRGDRPYTKGSPRAIAVTEAQEARIVAYLREHRDFKRHFPPNSKKSNAGLWGVGLKPTQCHRCARSDKAHYARGFCKPCYNRRSQAD